MRGDSPWPGDKTKSNGQDTGNGHDDEPPVPPGHKRHYVRRNGGGNGKDNGHDKNPWHEPPWIYPEDAWEAFNVSDFQDCEVPRRRWIAHQWLPALETTGFSGAGGQGKTLVAMMLATAKALGMHWFDIPLTEGPVFALLCEDRRADIHIRQARINQAFDCEFRDLTNLTVYPRRSHPHNRLMIFDRDGIGHTTPFFDQLLRKVEELHAELIILDTRADLFLGDQNDEDQARTFVRLVTDRLAEATGGACILLYQPSRAGVRERTGQSGSVQWHAAFRSGWYLESPEPEGEDPANPYARVLTRVKSNFAQQDETMQLQWDQGVFVRTDKPVDPGSGYRMQTAMRVFLALLADTKESAIPVSNNPASRNYAPRFFATRAKREGMKRTDFEKAMEALFYQKKIKNVPYGKASQNRFAIALVNGHAE